METGADIDHALAAGRFATETEDGAPFSVGERVKAAAGRVLHGPIKLQASPAPPPAGVRAEAQEPGEFGRAPAVSTQVLRAAPPALLRGVRWRPKVGAQDRAAVPSGRLCG